MSPAVEVELGDELEDCVFDPLQELWEPVLWSLLLDCDPVLTASRGVVELSRVDGSIVDTLFVLLLSPLLAKPLIDSAFHRQFAKKASFPCQESRP